MKKIKSVCLVTMLFLTGCGMKWDFWNSDGDQNLEVSESFSEKSDKTARSISVKSASAKELTLMNARLWTRIDSLEREVVRQKEMLAVLKKGLILGILPEELRVEFEVLEHGSEILKKPSLKKSEMLVTEKASSKNTFKKTEVIGTKKDKIVSGPLSKKEEDEYKKFLVTGQDLYRAGRYGKAITTYQEMSKKFSSRPGTGTHRYWLAAAWAELKEYQTSREYYSEFIKGYPENPWIARAKLDLARMDYQEGYRKRALNGYKKIIKEYPYEDASEMARMEIDKMKQAL